MPTSSLSFVILPLLNVLFVLVLALFILLVCLLQMSLRMIRKKY